MRPLPHAAARKRGPRLTNRKLTESETEVALRYLYDYVQGKPRPAHLAAEAMRCGLRTAERILSTGQPFTGRLKRRYVVNMSLHTGIPLENILRTCWQGYREHLGGWLVVQLPSAAIKAAAELAAGISIKALMGYGIRSDYTVTQGVNGRPSTVEMKLYNTTNGTHTLTFKESRYHRGLNMVYQIPGGHALYNGDPKADTIENILCLVARENKKILKYVKKNITTRAQRAARVSAPKKRGGGPAGHPAGPEGARL